MDIIDEILLKQKWKYQFYSSNGSATKENVMAKQEAELQQENPQSGFRVKLHELSFN